MNSKIDFKKNLLLTIVLIIGVSVVMAVIILLFYSQIGYVDLINKEVTISDDDQDILVICEEGGVVFEYSLEDWREGVSGESITVSDIMEFTAVSPFPEGVRTVGFAVSTTGLEKNFSTFWTLNLGTGDLHMIGEENIGVVGNIIWSPKETHFAYSLDVNDLTGEYLTVDNVETRKKEFVLSSEDMAVKMEVEDEFLADFRMIKWSDDGDDLRFVTNGISEDESIAWIIDKNGENLRLEN